MPRMSTLFTPFTFLSHYINPLLLSHFSSILILPFFTMSSFYKKLDIPPRKLRGAIDSPKVEDRFFSKYLPSNNNADDDDSDPYSSDEFRMFEFKIRKCTRNRSHDWTDCPFAHPGEKARRRDPRKFHYTGTICTEFRKGQCGKGDNCEFSHGVFECWMHPSRYRTEACKDGKNCTRKVCFFAHTTRQLRTPPEEDEGAISETITQDPASPPKVPEKLNLTHCCGCCHISPNSTLMTNVAHASPPISPPPITRENPNDFYGRLNELMGGMEGMNVTESVSSPMNVKNKNLPWLDVNFGIGEQQPHGVTSPSTLSTPGSSNIWSGGIISRFKRDMVEEKKKNIDESSNEGPDFGWVNDLLT